MSSSDPVGLPGLAILNLGLLAFLMAPFPLLLALAIAGGHVGRLWLATLVYALGIRLRVSDEERLPRAMFGAGFDSYAARVKRFVPGVM